MNLYFYKGKYPSFWYLNNLGWALFFILDTFLVSVSDTLKNLSNFCENSILIIIGYLITCGFRYFYKNYQYRTKTLLKVLGYVIMISIIGGILWYASMVLALLIFRSRDVSTIATVLTFRFTTYKLAGVIPLMTTWSLLYFGIKFWFEWSFEKERAEKADLLAQSAQLQMLRYQVNPHFLFNSFSSLRALIRTDQEKAEEMVTKLSEFYRYSLSTRDSKEVPLIEEIDAINYYFDIEKIRFGNKIIFELNVDPLAEEYPVPGFLIHPLIENAIKYGMKTGPVPLKVTLKADVQKGKLHLDVINTGKWIPEDKDSKLHGTGTGLSNIKSRLEYSYAGKHKFEIKEENETVIVSIEIFKEFI